MEKFIELELELRDGGSYYLCDSRFTVMSRSLTHQINAIERKTQHYSLVNGIAVKHTYEESVEIIRKARGNNDG
tara:strand:- start:114 stop:335 length:222 start_codon:yes stop_codon:yes gene_type:complete